jgi:DNA-binding CsgD family transcriptional regulator
MEPSSMAKLGARVPASSALDPLVRAIHAAGTQADGWPDVLEQLRRHFDARVVTLGHHEFATGCDSALIGSPEAERFGRDLAEYAARNPWFLSSADYRAGRVLTGDELISRHELRRTDFYRGFLQPRGLLHLLCGVVDKAARGVHLMAAYRAERQEDFGDAEKADWALLLDHVTLALHGQWRWQEASDMAAALLSLCDHDTNPTIIVTGDGEPIYRNAAADDLLRRRHGLCLEGARLAASAATERRLLSEAIARVARDDAQGEDAAAPAVLTLAGTPHVLPVVVVVRAAGHVFRRQTGLRHRLVKLVVRGDHGSHDPATCVFARQYELTAAQAKVSALVFGGQSLGSIALSLHLSENTVRSHLKQIFQKTDTHGQMELVHLHARVCQSLP